MPRQERFHSLHFVGTAAHYITIDSAVNVHIKKPGHNGTIAEVRDNLIWRGLRFISRGYRYDSSVLD
jgi:hypothetical protein